MPKYNAHVPVLPAALVVEVSDTEDAPKSKVAFPIVTPLLTPICVESAEVGGPFGVQFPGVAQAVPVAPLQS